MLLRNVSTRLLVWRAEDLKCVLSLISQVYYWRDSSQLRWHWVDRGMKSKEFPINGPDPSGVLDELIPYSNYKMYIVVANSRYEGPPSNNIHFSTPEGGKCYHFVNKTIILEISLYQSQAIHKLMCFSSPRYVYHLLLCSLL